MFSFRAGCWVAGIARSPALRPNARKGRSERLQMSAGARGRGIRCMRIALNRRHVCNHPRAGSGFLYDL